VEAASLVPFDASLMGASSRARAVDASAAATTSDMAASDDGSLAEGVLLAQGLGASRGRAAGRRRWLVNRRSSGRRTCLLGPDHDRAGPSRYLRRGRRGGIDGQH